jgi:leucyl aminopeptidase
MQMRRVSGRGLRRCGLLALPLGSSAADRSEIDEIDAATGGRLWREIRARSADPAREGAVSIYQTHGELPAEVIAVLGVGACERPGVLAADAWRRFGGRAIAVANAQRVRDLAISVATAADVATAEATGAVIEGALLASYRLEGFKSSRPAPRLIACTIVGAPASASASATAAEQRGVTLAEATCFSRDLINGPAEEITPAHLGRVAQRLARRDRLRVRVFGPAELRRMGMGAILAVGRGSRNSPRLIEMVYRPTASRGSRAAPRGAVALVGKGICFDSGGLSLKPAGSMEIQKRDMAGGAAVMGAMSAIARLGPPIEVRGYVAAAENMPGGNAYRPGDVLRTYGGKTVEVLNTDAEGRLVLADALGYAARDSGDGRPSWIIDVATLTGAVTTALGRGLAAVMGNDATLVRNIIEVARETGEPVWELPLVDEYAEAMKSAIADLKNTGDGTAGSIFGGLFLREFVSGLPWAHLDIASVAFSDKVKPYSPRGAVGWGVRTLVGLVERAAAGSVTSDIKPERDGRAPRRRSAARPSKGSRRRRA